MNRAAHEIAAAWRRLESILRRRPSAGQNPDPPALVRWDGGVRATAHHSSGSRVSTDMPRELGGNGDGVTPGWLFRAGLASCTATRIALAAAAEEIELDSLEVVATSRSDARGLFGMRAEDGSPISAGPSEVQMRVRIRAAGVSVERLRKLIEESHRRSPVACAVEAATPVELIVDVETR